MDSNVFFFQPMLSRPGITPQPGPQVVGFTTHGNLFSFASPDGRDRSDIGWSQTDDPVEK